MIKMIRLTFMILFCGFSLIGCSRLHIYKPDIQQGNVVNRKMLNSLHNGMSKVEVKKILGDPLLQNTFANNRMDYVYTYQPGNKAMSLRKIILTFRNDRLININAKLN